MARRLVSWREAGYRSIKIAAELDNRTTASVLAEIRHLASPDELELILDLGSAGNDVSRPLAAIRTWADHGISWVEDPVPVAAATHIAAIRAEASVPVAAGDEASPSELYELLEHRAVDLLRADSTTVGGLTGLCDIVAHANTPTALHAYPETHRHAAIVMRFRSPIETFPPGDDFDFVDRFIDVDDSMSTDGHVTPPTSPGLGFRYRPEAVPNNVVRSRLFTDDR